MYAYLLPGSEFHDRLREHKSNVDSTLMYATFDYTDNVPDFVLEWPQLDVGVTGTSDVQACLSEDGTQLYVHSKFDIGVRDCQMMFYRMSLLVRVELNNFVTDECTSFRRMYMNCSSLPYVDMSWLSAPYAEDFTEMFSGCSSCQSIDVRHLSVPSSAETCVYSDMFKGCASLRRLSVGEDFHFEESMSLSDPSTDVIPESDGLWHSCFDGTSSSSADLVGGVATTYFAVNPESTKRDNDLVTVSDIVSATQQIATAVARQLKYYSADVV